MTPNNPIDDTQVDAPTAKSTSVTTETPEAKATPVVSTPTATPGVVVLQWLTYAFWGWTLLALSVLIFLVIFNLLNQSDSGDATLYTVAAIVVLLPISLTCDLLYQKHETRKKVGVSMAVMVIHAVIFALFSIGTLIASLFSVVQLIVNTNSASDNDSYVAWLLSFLIVSILYAITFARTLNPLKNSRTLPRIYDGVMLALIGIFTVLAFMGPFALQLTTKQDRLIDDNISYVSNAIERHAERTKSLPSSLQDIGSVSEGGQQLIDDNLITYKAEKADPVTGNLRYQLCTTYTAKDSRSYGSQYDPALEDEYQSYISTYGHEAGDVCYKMQVVLPDNMDILINDKAQQREIQD